jgi:hypothetical protein
VSLLAFFAAETAVFAFSETSSATIVKQDSDLAKNQNNGTIVWEEISGITYSMDTAENDFQPFSHVTGNISSPEFTRIQLSIRAIASDPRDLRGRIFEQLFPFHFFW